MAFARTNLEKVIHFRAITPGLFRWGQFNENDDNNYEMTFCYLLEHEYYVSPRKKYQVAQKKGKRIY